MTRGSSKAFQVIGILAALVFFVIVTGGLSLQADLTADGRYTLSPASREIVRNLEEQVRLRLFFSRSSDELPGWLKNYATTVEDLLQQFERASNGRLTVEVIDPRPDTAEEEEAIRAGIDGGALATGDNLFFGLEAVQADQAAVIPMFNRQRERFLEYDIAELIFRTSQYERPVLGVISSLPMFGASRGPGSPGGSGEWLVIDQLRRTYEVRVVRGDSIPEDVSVLAVLHPPPLSASMRYAIDQFLLAGRPLFVAVDPSGFFARRLAGSQSAIGGSRSSNLETLFDAWGVSYNPDIVVGDARFAGRVPWGPNQTPLAYPFFIQAGGFDDSLSMTATLREVWFLEPGFFQLKSDSPLAMTPLVTTTRDSGTVDAINFSGFAPLNAEQNVRRFVTDGANRTLAAILSGTFETAFPEGKPPAPGDDEFLAEIEAELASKDQLKRGESTVVLVADSDFLADPLMGETVDFLGSRNLSLFNDNLALVSNIVDHLGGNRELLTLRGKGRLTRPFDRIDRIRARAQQEYQQEIEALEAELNRVQARISELGNQQREAGRLVAGAEARDAIDEFRRQEADVRREIRLIRKKVREDIENWKLALAAVNVLPVPLLVGGLGLIYFVRRSSR